MDEQLFRTISRLVRTVPLPLIEQIANHLETLTTAEPATVKSTLRQRIPQVQVWEEFHNLLTLWYQSSHTLSGSTLAFALRAAARTAEDQRHAEQSVLVWTGPIASGLAMRNTKQALLEVIDAAQQTLLVVSFAVYNIPTIQAALVRAASRGVQIRICVESTGNIQGKVAYDALRALGHTVAANAHVYVWPLEKRPQDEQGHYGALHAKCAVADGTLLFLSSANLTDYAFTLNMELGILIHGGPLPRTVQSQFARLIEDRVLIQVE